VAKHYVLPSQFPPVQEYGHGLLHELQTTTHQTNAYTSYDVAQLLSFMQSDLIRYRGNPFYSLFHIVSLLNLLHNKTPCLCNCHLESTTSNASSDQHDQSGVTAVTPALMNL